MPPASIHARRVGEKPGVIDDVEPAIGVEQGRRRAAGARLADDEHRHPGAVLRRVEALLDRIVVGVEGKLGRLPTRAPAPLATS